MPQEENLTNTANVKKCLYDVLCQDPLNTNNRPYITTIWWLLFFNGKLLHIFVTKHLPGQLYDILRICVEVLDYPIWVTMGIHRGWVFVFILFLDLHKNILTQHIVLFFMEFPCRWQQKLIKYLLYSCHLIKVIFEYLWIA